MKSAALLGGLLLAATSAFGGDGTVRRSQQRVANHYIVVLQSSADVDEVLAGLPQRVHQTYQRAIKGFAVQMSVAEAEALSRDPRVRFVEEDSILASLSSWKLRDRNDVSDGWSESMLYVIETGADGPIHGVAKSATLVPDSNGSRSISGLLAGIEWVLTNSEARPGVVSMNSRGVRSAALDLAARALAANGISVVTLDAPVQSKWQLLSDPGFDYDHTFWTSGVCIVIRPGDCTIPPVSPVTSHSGSTHVDVGGGEARNLPGSLLSEIVSIPSTATAAELSLYLLVTTNQNALAAPDVLRVEIRKDNGALLETLGTFNRVDASATYIQRRFDVTRFRGQTIRISFVAANVSGSTTFSLDDVMLHVWR
jgi:peptidase inhibitor I9